MKLPQSALAIAITLAVTGLATATIERLDLAQMTKKCDGALVGTITERHVVRIDHPVDGPELYFTALTIEGTSLKTGAAETVEVWFGGGFTDKLHGVHNSDAPSDDDQKLGNKVVAFYGWSPNMGGGHAGNTLITWHGGLYRTFENRKGQTIVQGRGDGYAIPLNLELGDLKNQVTKLVKAPK
jgi:hypothetical protein